MLSSSQQYSALGPTHPPVSLSRRYSGPVVVLTPARLKKEYSYTSTPLWVFMVGYRLNFTFYIGD